MTSLYEDIHNFHFHFGLGYDGPPRPLPYDMARFRTIFMAEELVEYVDPKSHTLKPTVQSALIEALNGVSNPKMLEKRFDALIDLVYVVLGTAHLHGFDFEEGWRRVHAANMKKIRCISPDTSTRGSTLDVIKPPGWEPPDLRDLCR